MEIEVEEEVSRLGVNIITDIISDVIVKPSRKDVFSILADEVRSEIKENYKSISFLKEDPKIRAYRSFYWKIGIDPTKTRLSSEALVRRFFRKGIPLINNMVDAGNLSSARSLIPIGLYDVGELKGDPVLRLSISGDIFRGIGGKDEVMTDGIPVLADDKGVIHLYPHRDSMRTRITERTEEVFMVACGVRGIRQKDLESSIEGVVYYYDQLRG